MTSHASLLPRYKRLREVGRSVANDLSKRLPKDVLEEGARKLGVLRGKTFVLGSEDEMAIVIDFCVHDVWRQGRNQVERYLEESPPPPGSDEMVFLQGLRGARYVIFVAEAIEPGVGVQGRDARSGDPYFVVDIGFGNSATPGLVLATRLLVADDITMTTGAALPIGVIPEHERESWVRAFASTYGDTKDSPPTPEKLSERNAAIIRSCLEEGASSHIAYHDVPGGPGHPRRSAPVPSRSPLPSASPGHIGRNDPCPCGSGKKFKNCCYRRG